MTREEAIKILVRLPLLRMCTRDTMDKVSDALNMAIEALNNIQVLDKIPKDYLYDAETNEFLVYRNKYTGKEIHILKPTDLFVLERPHGEWISCKDDNFYKCSECKQIVMSEERSNFCPNCGADMRVKTDFN